MHKKANADLRKIIKENGVYFWEVALMLGWSEATITRKFRVELSEADRKAILGAVKTLKNSKVG